LGIIQIALDFVGLFSEVRETVLTEEEQERRSRQPRQLGGEAGAQPPTLI